MIDCSDAGVRDLLPDYLHGALDARRRTAVSTHLASCDACTAELALLTRARAGIARAPVIDTARIVAALPEPARARVHPIGMAATPRASLWRGGGWQRLAAVALLTAGVLAVPAVRAIRTAVPEPAPTASPVAQSIAQPPAAFTVASGIADLSSEALETLIADLDALGSLPDAEPMPILALDAARAGDD